jgi:magnesium transporter
MIEERVKMLIASVKKLYHRDARHNIQRIFTKTHEADIATILESFEPGERFDLFKMESSLEKQSKILSHLKPETQKDLFSCLSKQESLKLIALMDTDDAADILGQLPGDDAQVILSSMTQEDSEEVSDLMGYPEDSAGGIMDSDYLALNQNLTVNEAIKSIQVEDKEVGVAFYVYVINDNNQLVGVLSLKTLLLSKNSEVLRDLMYTDVISVTVDTEQEKVAKVVEHYDFLSVPVVDQSNHLVGVITVDDIIDVIREEAEENLLTMGQAGLGIDSSTLERLSARLSWLMLALSGGLVCFSIVYYFGLHLTVQEESRILWTVAAFIPVLLSIGATIGSQAATVTVGALMSSQIEMPALKNHLYKETYLGIIFMVLFGVIIFSLSVITFNDMGLSFFLASTIVVQVFVSMILGNLIPLTISKFGMDASVASIPVNAILADVFAMVILFGLYHVFY